MARPAPVGSVSWFQDCITPTQKGLLLAGLHQRCSKALRPLLRHLTPCNNACGTLVLKWKPDGVVASHLPTA